MTLTLPSKALVRTLGKCVGGGEWGLNFFIQDVFKCFPYVKKDLHYIICDKKTEILLTIEFCDCLYDDHLKNLQQLMTYSSRMRKRKERDVHNADTIYMLYKIDMQHDNESISVAQTACWFWFLKKSMNC